MPSIYECRLKRFYAVLAFVDSGYVALDGAPRAYHDLVGALRQLVERLQQSDPAVGGWVNIMLLRLRLRSCERELCQQLLRIHRAARLAERMMDGFQLAISVPYRKRFGIEKLVRTARTVEYAVLRHREALVRCGLRDDFVDRLTAAIDAVTQAHTEYVCAGEKRDRFRGELRQAVVYGSDIVACLDGIVRDECAAHGPGRAVALRRWEQIVPLQRARPRWSHARRAYGRLYSVAGVKLSVGGTAHV